MVFIDTCVLVYATTPLSPFHQAARDALGTTAGDGAISRQVLREFLAVMSRVQASAAPLAMPVLAAAVNAFALRYSVLEDGPAVTDELLRLLASTACGGRQIHDANIVATMLSHGVTRLLTHNVADFHRFEPQIEVVPITS